MSEPDMRAPHVREHYVHDRWGGADVAAQVGGVLATIGSVVLLAGLVAGATNIAYRSGLDTDASEATTGGIVAGAIVLLLSLLAGGWVTGRMARFDGARNGLFTGVWFVFVLALVTAVGAWIDESYDFLDDARLPDWFSGEMTVAAVISAVVFIGLGLATSALGGLIGSRYHRRADDVLLGRERPQVEELSREELGEGAGTTDGDGAHDGPRHRAGHGSVA